MKAHHLHITPEDAAGNSGLGRYFLIPGSPSRAKLISTLFHTVTKEIITPRHNDTYLGTIETADGQSIDVGSTSSGMGVGSIEITMFELIEAGARRLLRVGTSGSIFDEKVRTGSYVIATGAVRDESASNDYLPPSFPALAHPDMVQALSDAARKLGLSSTTYRGIVHTKASLYGRARMEGPLKDEHLRFKEILRAGKVLSSEMEASVMFIMACSLSGTVLSLSEEEKALADVIKTGAILGIIGSESGWAGEEELKQIERGACVLALEAVRQLYLREGI